MIEINETQEIRKNLFPVPIEWNKNFYESMKKVHEDYITKDEKTNINAPNCLIC